MNRCQREERVIFRFVFLLNTTAEGETFVSSFRAAIREARTLTEVISAGLDALTLRDLLVVGAGGVWFSAGPGETLLMPSGMLWA